jgi:hypothetical protein
LARVFAHCETGNRVAMAPSRVADILVSALKSEREGGSPPYCRGATGADPTHGRRKSIVGTVKDPSRIGEVRIQSARQNRRQVHATTRASKAITGLAVIPEATRSDHLGV